MRKILYVIIIILLIGTMLISSYFIFKNKQEDIKQESTFEELIEIAEDKKQITDEKKENTINIKELYEINSDIIGWIKIEDTNINYPVMQTKDRPQFYLRKDFYKNYSQWGTPFLAENCDIKTSDNLIIYGHHINNSKMFGELENYRNMEFCEEHKYIKFYTKVSISEYEIISTFITTAGNELKSDELGKRLITLVTCDYSVKNGRLVVVAQKVGEILE